jgi:dTDP-4-amino-4,6-dideoxygalactose transaminase
MTPVEAPGVKHIYHLYVIRIPERDAVQAALKRKGIETGIHYPIPLPHLQAYRYLGDISDDFPVTTQYSREILSLPMYPELSEVQIEYVCQQLTKEIRA